MVYRYIAGIRGASWIPDGELTDGQGGLLTAGAAALGLSICVVGFLVWPLLFGSWHRMPPVYWSTDTDDASVLIVEIMGADFDPAHVRVEVKETNSLVQLTGWAWTSGQANPALGHPQLVHVQLRSPLNGRDVVAADGSLIPRSPS